jgi:hypothetical protein
MQEYNEIDQFIHQLCQIIAKVNRTFVPAKEDDSHTNLYFDSITNRIHGRWIKSNNGDVIFSLDLFEYKFQWFDTSFKELKSYSINGKTSSELESEIEQDLPSFGLDAQGFKDELHFEIPDYAFKKDAFLLLPKERLEVWCQYRAIANIASMQVLGTLQQKGEIRIWPHHFDTGIYAIIPEKIGIGFGLAMKDSVINESYFYLSGYPSTGELDFSKISSLTYGKWITNSDWTGAVLSLGEIKNLSRSETANVIDIFIKETVQWYLR